MGSHDHVQNIVNLSTNPELDNTMGVVLPGFPFCPMYRAAISHLIGPGATAPTVCDLLWNAAICDVAIFNPAFSNMSEKDPRACLEGDMINLGIDLYRDHIFKHLVILRKLLKSEVIRGQFGPSKRENPQQTHQTPHVLTSMYD